MAGHTVEVPNLSTSVTITDPEPVFTSLYSLIKKGQWKPSEDSAPVMVAIKIPRLFTQDHSKMRRKIRRGTRMWWTLKHPNILPLYGTLEGEDIGTFGGLVSPWCSRGNAADYLQRNTISTRKRMELWQGVANGLDYLHTHDPQIIHANLKPNNILIDEHENPLICDFALIRVEGTLKFGMTMKTPHAGTAVYLARELVADANSLPSTYSDVHALGCIGLVFVLRTRPHQGSSSFTAAVYIDIHNGQPPAERPLYTEGALVRLWDFLDSCWEQVPNKRPSAAAVSQFITEYGNEIIEEIETPKSRRIKNRLAFPLLEDQESNELDPFRDDSGLGSLPDFATGQGSRPININVDPATVITVPEAERHSPIATPSSSLRPILRSSESYSKPGMDMLPSPIPVGLVDVYEAEYRAYSITNLPQHTEFSEVAYSGKVLLPLSAYQRLSELRIPSPWMFRLRNPVKATLFTHAGVLEFTAEPNSIILPNWMMKTLRLSEGSTIRICNVSLPKASSIKFRPQENEFFTSSRPEATLRKALRNFSCLTQGDNIQVTSDGILHNLLVVETRTADQSAPEGVSLTDTNVAIELVPPKNWKKPLSASSKAMEAEESVVDSEASSTALPTPSDQISASETLQKPNERLRIITEVPSSHEASQKSPKISPLKKAKSGGRKLKQSDGKGAQKLSELGNSQVLQPTSMAIATSTTSPSHPSPVREHRLSKRAPVVGSPTGGKEVEADDSDSDSAVGCWAWFPRYRRSPRATIR